MRAEFMEKCRASLRDESLCMEVTTRCNSACLHCFVKARTSQSSNLSAEAARAILSEGYSSGYRNLHITGGEPLLWRALFDILDYTFAVGYRKVSMNSNGTLLTPEIAARLSIYAGLSISISLEGPGPIHDELRGKGSHGQALRGIGHALDAQLRIAIFTVARKRLLPVLPNFVEDIYKRFPGIDHLTLIQLLGVAKNELTLSKELLDPRDFLKLVKTVALLNLYGLKTHVKNSPLANVAGNLFGMPWIPRAYPLCGPGSIMMRANGEISLSHSGRETFGNYRPGKIQNVLSSIKYQRSLMADVLACYSCKHNILCNKYGLEGSLEPHGAFNSIEPYCKRVLDSILQQLS